MDDKQIIIDGVDVSGCTYIIPPHKQCPNKPMPYAKETSCIACKEHNTKRNFCKNNPNCYYKQYKRKEQENEELKEILKEGCLHNLTLMTEQRVLLQTLTEIKDYCNKYPQNSIGFKKYILQKIKEVLNGTNP